MDGARFDRLARAFAGRLTRRHAVAGGIGLATAGSLGVTASRPAPVRAARQSDTTPEDDTRTTIVRRWRTRETDRDIARQLRPLIAEMAELDGFVRYEVVNDGARTILTIATFLGRERLVKAGEFEAEWIADEEIDLEPIDPETLGGKVLAHGEIGVDCPCNPDADTCSGELVCCPGDNLLTGAAGACLPPVATCENEACTRNPGDGCSSDDECCLGACTGGVCNCGDPTDPWVSCWCDPDLSWACNGNPDWCCPLDNGSGACAPGPGLCADVGCRENGEACPASCDWGMSCDDCCQGFCGDDGLCSGACSWVNDPCTDDSDCCTTAPLICVGGVCEPDGGCLPPGSICQNGDPCCDGNTCFEGICDNPQGCAAPGDSCTGYDDCCLGSCSDAGVCYCSDPDFPHVGCTCSSDDASACGWQPELCCGSVCVGSLEACV